MIRGNLIYNTSLIILVLEVKEFDFEDPEVLLAAFRVIICIANNHLDRCLIKKIKVIFN